MTLMMKAAPRAVEIVAAPYVGVFNVAIAFGAWAGGQAVDGPGLSANLWLAAGFAAAALLLSLTISVVEHAMKAADKQLGSATNGHHLSIAEEQRLTLQAPVVSIMDRRTRKQKPCLPHWRTKP